MYLDSSKTAINGKTYQRHLLRESYREDGKVKNRTIASLSHCSFAEIEAIRLALQQKALLDGYYVIRSGVKKQTLSAEELRNRYKYLANLARAFRTFQAGASGDQAGGLSAQPSQHTRPCVQRDAGLQDGATDRKILIIR
ncbi:MAG: hypothetical protein HGB15_03655 [Chlorobaculum sp.]|nr:hypothetical protein [Chlorobaculum sp.]